MKYIILLITIVLLSSCTKKSPEEIAKENCEDDIAAYVFSTMEIKKKIKSPSTIDIPLYDKHVYAGDCNHYFTGSFDAQNSFGATVRTRYAVKVQYNSKTDWYVLKELAFK